LLPAGEALLLLVGSFGVKRFLLSVEGSSQITRSALFIKDVAVAMLRQDRLALMAANLMPGITVSDDYLWEKLIAAEAYVAGLLRVPLVPTRYVPIQPTAEELAALGGMPWRVDPGYDYVPEMFERDKWGYLVTRHRPVISVEYVRFAYPTQNQGFFNVPLDWLRVDSRPGHVRIVPSNSALLMGTAGFAMTSMINRRSIPDMVQVAYTAGLQNIQTVHARHGDVQQHHIDALRPLQGLHRIQHGGAGVRFGYHLHGRVIGQHHLQAFAHDLVVIAQQHPHGGVHGATSCAGKGMDRRMRVPRPGWLSMSITPPKCRARSRMPMMP
jgi:hypothetical protein